MNAREWTCLWYLRLNGYFTIPNFIAHRRNGQLTEVDILGVRFPSSHERINNTDLGDDDSLEIPGDRTDIVFAEAKVGEIQKLNGPWRNRETRALDYVLRRVGVVPPQEVPNLAEGLYDRRRADGTGFGIRIVAFADSIAQQLRDEGVVFVSWKQVLQFIHERFSKNERLKGDIQQWDEFGQYLWHKLSGIAPGKPDDFFDGWETWRRHRLNL